MGKLIILPIIITIQHLQAFEENIVEMVQSVKFRITRSRFQNELFKIVRDILKCKNLIAPANKTYNFKEISVKTKKIVKL